MSEERDRGERTSANSDASADPRPAAALTMPPALLDFIAKHGLAGDAAQEPLTRALTLALALALTLTLDVTLALALALTRAPARTRARAQPGP